VLRDILALETLSFAASYAHTGQRCLGWGEGDGLTRNKSITQFVGSWMNKSIGHKYKAVAVSRRPWYPTMLRSICYKITNTDNFKLNVFKILLTKCLLQKVDCLVS